LNFEKSLKTLSIVCGVIALRWLGAG